MERMPSLSLALIFAVSHQTKKPRESENSIFKLTHHSRKANFHPTVSLVVRDKMHLQL